MIFYFNIPVFRHILDRCSNIVLNWCMLVIGIKFWKINRYVLTIHFYFIPERPHLCVPWIYTIQYLTYLAESAVYSRVSCLIWNAHICSFSASPSFLYKRVKSWLVSKGHLSKQLVCIREGDDIMVRGFGWGSWSQISLRDHKSVFMCYWLLSQALWLL